MTINSMTQSLIDEGESSKVELIASVEDLNQIAQTVVAFLNTKGGTIIVGLDGDNVATKKLSASHVNKLEKYLRSEISPPIMFAVSLDDCSYGKVIVVEIPQGRDRPFTFQGKTLVRSGSAVKPATGPQIRKMVEEDTAQPRWERRISSGLTLGELNKKLIKRTIQSAIEVRGMTFELPDDHESTLNELWMMQLGGYTNAADVSFADLVAGRLPQVRVRAVCYETDRAGDRFSDDQLFEGPSLKLYKDAMAFFRRHVSVANTFHPGESRRESKPEYPFKSLREGIINALAHRDYTEYSGSIQLSIYPDRIEIWNSGKLVVSPSKLAKAKHESVLTNPDISHVFYMNDLMERVGRGTYNIVQECEQFEMRPPKWENTGNGVRLTFYTSSSIVTAADELPKRLVAFLERLKPGDSISFSEYMESDGTSERQARRDLKELTDLGFLERYGSARSTRYKRTELKPE